MASGNSNTAFWIVGLGVIGYFLYKNKIGQPGISLPPQTTRAHLSPCTVPAFVDVRGTLWAASPHGVWNAELNHCEPTSQHPAYATPPTGGIRCPSGQILRNGQCVPVNTNDGISNDGVQFRLS